MTQYRQFCTFQLDRFTCGVDIRSIQEVIAWHEITPVPFTPPALRGLINLRGQMVIAIDLRRQFGLSDFAADQLPMNVVVQTTDGLVSLLVDRIGDVMEVADDAFERQRCVYLTRCVR